MRAGLAKQPGVEDLQGGNPGSNTGEPSPAALTASVHIGSSCPDVDRIDFRGAIAEDRVCSGVPEPFAAR